MPNDKIINYLKTFNSNILEILDLILYHSPKNEKKEIISWPDFLEKTLRWMVPPKTHESKNISWSDYFFQIFSNPGTGISSQLMEINRQLEDVKEHINSSQKREQTQQPKQQAQNINNEELVSKLQSLDEDHVKMMGWFYYLEDINIPEWFKHLENKILSSQNMRELEDAKEKLIDAENIEEQLRQELQILDFNKQQLHSENERFKQQLLNINNENEKFRQELDHSNNENERLQKRLQKTSGENEELKQQLQKIKIVAASKLKFKNENEELKQQLQKIAKRLQTVIDEKKQKQLELEKSKSKLEKSQLELKDSKLELEKSKSKLEESQLELEVSKLELEYFKKALQIAIQTTQQDYSSLKEAWLIFIENLEQTLLTDPLYQQNFTQKTLGMLNIQILSEEIQRVFEKHLIDLDPNIAPSIELLNHNGSRYARLPEELWRAASQIINAHYITINHSKLEDLRAQLAQLNPYEKEKDLFVILSDPNLKNPNEYERCPVGFKPFEKYIVGIVLRVPYISANHSAPVMFIE